jgi:DHA2 family multidrug resistance protein
MSIAWDRPGLVTKESPWYALWTIGNVLVTTFLGVVSALATILADDAIQGDLALSQPAATWITTLYLLGINTSVPASGWLAERFGFKTIYAAGLAIFALGSATVGLATNFTTVALGRVIEGVGAGAIFPVGLAIVTQTIDAKHLPLILIIYMGACFGAGYALGLPLSGYFAQFVSWRVLFFLIAASTITGLICCWLVQEETGRDTSQRFDLFGFLFFALFVASLLIALTYGPLRATAEGWRSPHILALLATALLCLGMTCWIESSHPNPILPFALFKEPIFAVASLAMFLLGMSIFASVGTMVQYMTSALHYEKYVSGEIGSIYGIGLFAASVVGNLLIKKIPVACMTFVGLAILVISYLLNNILDWQTGPPPILAIMLLRGIGLGLALGPTTVQAMLHVPPHLTAKGAMLLTFFRQVGGTYGGTLIAILTIQRTIFHAQRFSETVNPQQSAYRDTLERVAAHFYHSGEKTLYESAQQAHAAIAQHLLNQAFIQAINDAMTVIGYVTGIVAIALALLTIYTERGSKVGL